MFIPLLTGCVHTIPVEPDACVVPDSSVEISMFDSMIDNLKIDQSVVARGQTKMELLDNRLVSPLFAEYLAQKSWDNDKDKWLSVERYKRIYSEHNVRNLIVKITYFNNERKKNVFIASALVNDDECSIDFNGYIIVSREF
ncbi:Shiga toxin A subunit [Pantoea sp. BAV 3049]|uniref:Shiga toxin A subunit n=1 Tax=Pantoea sp. BAV 3049 TaxID=2654188 RepID=UPI00131B68F8|nr:Shiga toxin A subunit [Pantoea sp. BAV 3049]